MTLWWGLYRSVEAVVVDVNNELTGPRLREPTLRISGFLMCSTKAHTHTHTLRRRGSLSHEEERDDESAEQRKRSEQSGVCSGQCFFGETI